MANNRRGRINEEVLKALSEALRSVKDPRISDNMVSIIRCEVTGDLRFAKAYVSVLGSEEATKNVMQGLKSASGFLRSEVGRIVQLRYAPELIFVLDNSISHGAYISKLLNDNK